MNGIKNVRIQIADPERSIFEEQDEVPTASVMLILDPGYKLKSSQVKAIKNLVAYAIPRLTLIKFSSQTKTAIVWMMRQAKIPMIWRVSKPVLKKIRLKKLQPFLKKLWVKECDGSG